MTVAFGTYVYLYGGGKVVPATYSISSDLTTITITPTSPLATNTLYYIYAYYVQNLAGGQTTTSSYFYTGAT
jgi:hypothetical protein